MQIDDGSPCEVSVTPDARGHGGVNVEVFVPTYGGGTMLHLTVERDNDGDWVVYLPMWPEEDGPVWAKDGENDYEVCNGILYLGAPDVPVDRKA